MAVFRSAAKMPLAPLPPLLPRSRKQAKNASVFKQYVEGEITPEQAGLEQDESKKDKTEKERLRNRSMLTHERNGLAVMSLTNSSEVTATPSDDITSSSRGGVGDSGFLSRYASDSAAMTLADTNLQLEKEKNEGLQLQLQLEQARERREMDAIR